jgi:PAS domain S-box-containing protein
MSSGPRPRDGVTEAAWTTPVAGDSAPPAGNSPRSTTALLHDIEVLRDRLQEAEETLRAIRLGEVDALVVQGPDGPRTYTLITADQAYRRIIEQMGEGALTLNPDGLILYCNTRFCSMLGLPMTSVTGRYLSEFWIEQGTDPSKLLRTSDASVAIGEVALRGADGSAVPVQLSLSTLKTDAFTGICAIATDLTERKQREQHEADERLTHGILEHAAEAILLCDHTGLIVRANPIAETLWGRNPVGSLFDNACAGAACFEDFTASSDRDSERREMPYRRPDGTEFHLSVSVRAVNAGGKGAPMFVVMLADVTHRKQAEAERIRLLDAERAARAEAEAANRAKTDFLGVMSHELRTPLNAIIGHGELVASGIHGPVTSEQVGALARIRQSADHLLGLIDSLLGFVRIEGGHVEYRIRSGRVSELIEMVESLTAPQIQLKNLEYVCHAWDSEKLTVNADMEKALQILLNLLGNAVKFTPAGGRIGLSVVATDDQVRFHVQDTGIGIPTDQLETIFDPFVQLDRRLTCGNTGVGLGLTISRDLARGMGGDLYVESRPGDGSTFTLALPKA